MLNLRSLREHHPRLRVGDRIMSQQELAEIMGVSSDQISRWEQLEDVSENIPARPLHRLSNYLGISMEDLMNWSPEESSNLFQTGFGDPLAEHTKRAAILENHVGGRLRELVEESRRDGMTSTLDLADQLRLVQSEVLHRPLIALVGAFDSGKSSMANIMLDANTIPVAWQPLTAAPVLLRHQERRPSALPPDDRVFLIFPHDRAAKPTQFEFRRIDDPDYMARWHIEPANDKDLREYTTRQSRMSREERAVSVLILSDAPVLRYCDIVDTPGFDAGLEDGLSDQDAETAESVTREADGFILMSKMNGFLAGQDIMRLNDLLRRPVPLYGSNNTPIPLGHVLVVATQADIDPLGVTVMLDAAADRVFGAIRRDGTRGPSQLARVAFEYCEAEYKRSLTYTDFRSRLVPFSTKRVDLQRDLRSQLQIGLLDPIISLFAKRQDEIVGRFKSHASEVLANEIRRYEAVMHERQETQKQLDHAKATRDSNRARLRAERDDVIHVIDAVRESNVSSFSAWWSRTITPENVEREIRQRGYGRKEAQEYIGQNLIDLAKDEVISTLNDGMSKHVGPKLDSFFDSYKEYALKDLSIGTFGSETIPFDFQGAVAGGLASAAVLGGLAIWASTFGSLGWYVLAAKGVSLLAALGISVGGTAAGISAIAALGGPILWAVGLAVLAGILIWSLFGKSWQRRLAEKVCDVLNEKELRGSIIGDMNRFWNDTKDGVMHVVQHLENRIDEHIADMERLLQETQPEKLQGLIDKCHDHKSFFEGLPWSTP